MLLLSSFQFTIHSTIMGSIFVFLILILKALFKNNLKLKLLNCLWIFFIIRLLIPYAPETSFSIYNLNPLSKAKIIQKNNITKYFQDTFSTNNTADHLTESSINYDSLKNKNINTASSYENKLSCLEVLAVLWISVCIILIIATFTTITAFYLKLRKEKTTGDYNLIKILNSCRQKMHITKYIEIINTPIIKSPAIFGFIHPKILFPLNINKVVDSEQLSCIIFHELAHLKRKDIIIDFIVSMLKIMHWFNPIILYAFIKMNQDKELLCDEMALNYCNCNKYGHTIIRLLEVYKHSNYIYGLDCIINNKREVERRITMISLFKKTSPKWTILSIVLLLLIGGITLTNPKNITAAYKNNTEKSSLNTIEELSISTRTFKGKILVVKDPSKVEVGYTEKLLKKNKTTGELAKENKALCAINANYIPTKVDINNKYSLPETEGIIIHNGNVIYKSSEDTKYNIAGFTDKNVLISGQYSIEELKKMNVTEVVNSQIPLIKNGKPLLESKQPTGINPRTAIAQRKDGTVLMVVIDGRSVDSIGASMYDLQQILLENGAYTAAALDGGISSTMYYKGNIINKPASGVQWPISSIFMIKNN